MTATHEIHIDIPLVRRELDSLFDEIRRYLDAVDTFRREGCEPRWRDEGGHTEVLR